MASMEGIDPSRSTHPDLSEDDWELFAGHFSLFPWDALPPDPVGFELACGSGRWASLVAQRAAHLHCIDRDEGAAERAAEHLDGSRCTVSRACPAEPPLDVGSMDFGYCLGVLGPSAESVAVALREAVLRLKPGAPFLLYLLYALDNRPLWFRGLWTASDLARRAVAAQPPAVTRILADGIAAAGYLPLARSAAALESLGLSVESVPLSPYRHASFDAMRQGALERFARQEEPRFTADQIRELMTEAGLEGVTLSEETPYWTAVGYRPR